MFKLYFLSAKILVQRILVIFLQIRLSSALLLKIELLKRAALCITHAGLNTVLESLAHGVPKVAIPIGYDQPGTAARIKHHGTGEFIELEQLTTHRLRGLIEKVLHDPSYRERARYFQKVISKTRGLDVAADIIEQAFQKYQTEVPRAVF